MDIINCVQYIDTKYAWTKTFGKIYQPRLSKSTIITELFFSALTNRNKDPRLLLDVWFCLLKPIYTDFAC